MSELTEKSVDKALFVSLHSDPISSGVTIDVTQDNPYRDTGSGKESLDDLYFSIFPQRSQEFPERITCHYLNSLIEPHSHKREYVENEIDQPLKHEGEEKRANPKAVIYARQLVEDQVFSPTLIAGALRTTKSEIASTLGLGRDAFSRASRVRARKTQTRLREMVEILNRVEAQTGSPLAAYAWFRSEPLPGFGALTPDQLVREGKAAHVHAYLDRIMAGGYA